MTGNSVHPVGAVRVHYHGGSPVSEPVSDLGSMLTGGQRKQNPPASFPAGAGGWTASGAYPSSSAPLTRVGNFPSWDGPVYPWYGYAGTYYPYAAGYMGRLGSQDCIPPISSTCNTLQITRRWAVVCFMRDYNAARAAHGDDAPRVAAAIATATSLCRGVATPAAVEFMRRIMSAVALLMRGEGVNVALPPQPQGIRPADAMRYKQPWVRVLMTGWV